MALAEQPLITFTQDLYGSTNQTQDLQGSVANSTLTEGPHSIIQVWSHEIMTKNA